MGAAGPGRPPASFSKGEDMHNPTAQIAPAGGGVYLSFRAMQRVRAQRSPMTARIEPRISRSGSVVLTPHRERTVSDSLAMTGLQTLAVLDRHNAPDSPA